MRLLEHDNHHKKNSRADHKSSSSNIVSSSSSSKSSPSSNPSVLIPPTIRRRTVEEVWNDISLTTLHHERLLIPLDHQSYHHHHPASSPSFKGMILQDFLAGPLNRPRTISPHAVEELPLLPPPLSPTLPQTALSLNSGMEFEYLRPHADSHSNSSSNGQNACFIPFAISGAIDGPPSPTALFSFCSKNRLPENSVVGTDRYRRRMIKNRESAARSRARKQAYTNELELEVSRLKEENAKLKKQYEELRSAMAAQQLKSNTLQRSSTAPF
ncbi:protein FD-like [Musa acuminata AAA Group]|uniref:protein FD-like n=1 Tax=Musa acuminata AAA Group TaxID=214697 RepID=UPI0031D7F601